VFSMNERQRKCVVISIGGDDDTLHVAEMPNSKEKNL